MLSLIAVWRNRSLQRSPIDTGHMQRVTEWRHLLDPGAAFERTAQPCNIAALHREGVQPGVYQQFTDRAIGAIVLTVLLSVALHGITARPGGRAYVRREQRTTVEPASEPRARRVWLRSATP